MAAPPADVEVALTILQAVGLLIPVVFIALRPFYRPNPDRVDLDNEETKIYSSIPDSRPDFRRETVDEFSLAAPAVRAGWGVVAAFAIAGVLAGARVLTWAVGSWLIVAAVAFLVTGFLGLGLLLYFIRDEFISTVEEVR